MGLLPNDRDLTEPPETVELSVDASDFRIKVADLVVRLDHFLAERISWRSRNSIQKLIREGFVMVDASPPDRPRGGSTPEVEKRPGRKLRHGSRVIVVIPEENRRQFSADAMGPIDVLFEDDEVLVVNKPPHVAVHPSGRHYSDTLIQRVHAHFKDEIQGGDMAPRLCHRLDRETSGIVLIAKRPAGHTHLRLQFESRSVRKAYQAIVCGVPTPTTGSIRSAIGSSRASAVRLKMAVRADGLESRTDYAVLEEVGPEEHRHALVRCELFTGRQHQIRVHLAAQGHPIVGDKLYGPDEALFQRSLEGELSASDLKELEHERHALHNALLVFESLASGPVEVICPLAPDLQAFLDARRGA
jgi:23S rRNA pseudouridine1911/1915/1917 synthase